MISTQENKNLLCFFNNLKNDPSDINEHLETLKYYASRSNHVTELGVRKIVSSWAFLLGAPHKLVCVDIIHPNDYLNDNGEKFGIFKKYCELLDIDFEFILGDTLKIEIEETDLLFIDTLHTYDQLKRELALHANKVKNWIIFHDTESCGEYFISSNGVREGGLTYAINEFLVDNPQWKVKSIYKNNNGLTVLEREMKDDNR